MKILVINSELRIFILHIAEHLNAPKNLIFQVTVIPKHIIIELLKFII